MMSRRFTRIPLVVTGLICIAGVAAAAQENRSPAERYLELTRAYADAMIEHGRDTYGEMSSPLFASALDRTTLRLPETLPDIEGVRAHDRSYRGGNPMHDLCLYLLLYDLTEVTGDAKYAREADAALEWFFHHAQSPATGLFAWGEHLYWDFVNDTVGGNDIHEFYRPWLPAARSYALAPGPMEAYARGLWFHQIGDHERGYFSRHARWSEHRPATGNEFPRHGGFYIAQWADAYAHSGRYLFLAAIEALLDYFESARHPETGAIPAVQPGADRGNIVWTTSNVSLAIDLWEGAAKVPEPLAERMRASALANDAHFLRLEHDLGPAGRGFVATASRDEFRAPSKGAFCPTWASGYGDRTNAGTAMMCYERHLQGGNDGYRRLILEAAALYLEAEPDSGIELFPGAFADPILLMIAANRLENSPRYLERAMVFADQAVALFWDDGPLPRASSRTDHYETLTRGDLLARALLILSCEMSGKRLETLYPDR